MINNLRVQIRSDSKSTTGNLPSLDELKRGSPRRRERSREETKTLRCTNDFAAPFSAIAFPTRDWLDFIERCIDPSVGCRSKQTIRHVSRSVQSSGNIP